MKTTTKSFFLILVSLISTHSQALTLECADPSDNVMTYIKWNIERAVIEVFDYKNDLKPPAPAITPTYVIDYSAFAYRRGASQEAETHPPTDLSPYVRVYPLWVQTLNDRYNNGGRRGNDWNITAANYLTAPGSCPVVRAGFRHNGDPEGQELLIYPCKNSPAKFKELSVICSFPDTFRDELGGNPFVNPEYLDTWPIAALNAINSGNLGIGVKTACAEKEKKIETKKK